MALLGVYLYVSMSAFSATGMQMFFDIATESVVSYCRCIVVIVIPDYQLLSLRRCYFSVCLLSLYLRILRKWIFDNFSLTPLSSMTRTDGANPNRKKKV